MVPRLIAMLGIAPPSVAKDADPDALPEELLGAGGTGNGRVVQVDPRLTLR